MINIKSTPLLKKALAAAVSLAILPSQVTWAEERTVYLEEIVVQAQKRSQTTQDVPSSIAAVTDEMLKLSNTTDFGDLGKITAGVNIGGNSDGFAKVIRIRGVGTNAFVATIAPSVGIFVDDVPLAAPESAYNNMADVARIEILKGPQSTLFGKGVSSGAINMYTRAPALDEMDGYLEGNFGNLETQEYRAGVNLPLTDTLAVRGSLYHARKGPVIDNLISDDGPDREATGGRLRLLFEPSDELSMIASFEQHDINVNGAQGIVVEYGDLMTQWSQLTTGETPQGADPFDRQTETAVPNGRDTHTRNFALTVEYALNDDWILNSVTSVQDYSLYLEGTDGFDDGSAATSTGPIALNQFTNSRAIEAKTQELRLSYSGESLTSIVGAFYSETDQASIVPFLSGIAAVPAGIFGPEPELLQSAGISHILENTEEWAVFNHNTLSLSEALDVTLGLRYSEVTKSDHKGQPLGVGPYAAEDSGLIAVSDWGGQGPAQSNTWEALTGSLKVNYYLTSDVSVYAGFDRGFKAGGHNVTKYSVDSGGLTEDGFDSEIADNFEVGMKGYFLEQTLRLNASLYRQAYSDYQVEVQDEIGIGNGVQNAAEVIVEGAELEVQWQASDKLLLDGSLAYVDARYDSYQNANCTRVQYRAVACDALTQTQDLSGQRLNATSPWTANLNATWKDTFSNGMSWYLRAEAAFRDDAIHFPDLEPASSTPSYTLFNASFGISPEDASWDLVFWGKNLGGEDYLTGLINNRDASRIPGAASEGLYAVVGAPRTYGTSIRYHF